MVIENVAIRPLTLADAKSVIELEKRGFSEEERASRETIQYRLTACPELCIGLFQREFEKVETNPRHSTIKSEKLIGHIISTKMISSLVDEASMKVNGHFDSGNTIGLHSIVIDPEFRKSKLATLLLKDYLQRMGQQDVAHTVAILARPQLIDFYTQFGFVDRGVSKCEHGGEKWHDMVVILEHADDEEDE